MTNPFDCNDKTQLVAYLYGEIGEADRDAVEAHLADCQACTDEVASLESVRVGLTSWQPPDANLGFRIVRDAVPVTPAWWRAHAWAPAALAAGLVLAVGAAMANVEVQVANGGITLRAGWSHAPLPTARPGSQSAGTAATATAPAAAPVPAGVSEAEVHKMLAAFETRLRANLAAAPRQTAASTPASAVSFDRQQMVQQMRTLVDESERRQQRELALRLADVVQDFDAQRRTDLVHIERGFGQIESLAGQQAASQRAITNYLVRASQRQ